MTEEKWLHAKELISKIKFIENQISKIENAFGIDFLHNRDRVKISKSKQSTINISVEDVILETQIDSIIIDRYIKIFVNKLNQELLKLKTEFEKL